MFYALSWYLTQLLPPVLMLCVCVIGTRRWLMAAADSPLHPVSSLGARLTLVGIVLILWSACCALGAEASWCAWGGYPWVGDNDFALYPVFRPLAGLLSIVAAGFALRHGGRESGRLCLLLLSYPALGILGLLLSHPHETRGWWLARVVLGVVLLALSWFAVFERATARQGRRWRGSSGLLRAGRGAAGVLAAPAGAPRPSPQSQETAPVSRA